MSTPLLRFAGSFPLLASLALAQGHNYSEAFQKSLFFYEIQHSGPIPLDHRVEWRGPAAIRDGADVGRDLSGGWFDAGDGVVWTGNDAFGASMLAWSLVKYRDVYIQTGQYQIAIDRLREISDYLTKIVQLDGSGNITRIYCGKGSIGHKPPNDPALVNDRTGGQPNELLDTLIGGATQSIRPSYWVDSVTGGADIAGAVSSALASASIAFREYGDATRANQLLALSKQAFAWGDANRNLALTVDGVATKIATRRLTSGSPVTLPSYASRVETYMPRMIYAAAWLHRADHSAATSGYTNAWVNKAESLYNEPVNTSKLKHWQSFATGTEHNGAYTMLAADSGRAAFVTEANNFANFWLNSRSNTSGLATDPTVTPAGFIARGAGPSWNVHTLLDTAPPLLDWADSTLNTNATQKANLVSLFTGTYGPACPVKQIDYILGSNPAKLSYLAGYTPTGTGYDWPRNIHHRALGVNYGGFGTPAADKVQWNLNIPYGLVVPGPDKNDYYPVSTPLTSGTTLGYQEPIIYSGGILTVLARNIRAGGSSAGTPLGTFPDWQTRPSDYQTRSVFVQAKSLSSTSVEFELNNRADFPPRENDTLGFRYYFVPDGTAGSNVTCTATGLGLLAGESVSVSPATQVGSTGVWYFAVTLNDAMIVPSEYNRFRRTVRLDFSQTGGGTFSLANDPSGSAITSTQARIANIPVYDTGFTPWKILGGFEPSGAGYIQWRRAHFNNVMESAGSVVLIAERVGGSAGAVSATVSLANGSATAPADYTVPANTTLSWSNGQMGEKTLSVPIVNDLFDERRHHFTATLGGLTGGAVAGITTTARVSIEDDDHGSTATPPPPPGLTAPTNLNAAASTSNIVLTWSDANTAESGFKVERKTATTSFVELYRGTTANQTSYTDTTVTTGVTYTYQVRAYTANVANGPYSVSASATLAVPTPTPPPATNVLFNEGNFSTVTQGNFTAGTSTYNVVHSQIGSAHATRSATGGSPDAYLKLGNYGNQVCVGLAGGSTAQSWTISFAQKIPSSWGGPTFRAMALSNGQSLGYAYGGATAGTVLQTQSTGLQSSWTNKSYTISVPANTHTVILAWFTDAADAGLDNIQVIKN